MNDKKKKMVAKVLILFCVAWDAFGENFQKKKIEKNCMCWLRDIQLIYSVCSYTIYRF